jgi:Tol biopolymer transport system component
MTELPSAAPRSGADSSTDRLDSWKEIAAYLRRDVTTVQRWEKREGMPVHRHLHDKVGSVYAFQAELDAWVRGRHAAMAGGREADDPGAGATASEPASNPESAAVPPIARAVRRPVWLLMTIAAVLAAAGIGWLLLDRSEAFWRSPIAEARFQQLTDFPGTEQAAAVSPDGRFVAFASDRDGQVDLWLTQVGTGRFYNLTRGAVSDIVNPSVRTIGFSPDGAFVTFWRRSAEGPGGIGIWAVPILGGQMRPYLEGAAEFDWSGDGARLVYHTPGPGDPTFVRDPGETEDRQIFIAPPGLHSHFPLWSIDRRYIYFVQGSVPDQMDIWRWSMAAGTTEQVTHHGGYVSHPIFLDESTLLYLASDAAGFGPWLYSVDVERRIPRRVSAGIDRYTSLAASAGARRLVVTQASTKHTFWRAAVADFPVAASAAERIALTTSAGRWPRLGPAYLAYVVSKEAGDSIWKLQGDTVSELWSAAGARLIAGPAIAPDGRKIAFAALQQDRTRLHVMNADGTDARVLADSLRLRGAPAWAADGRSITIAALQDAVPRLFNISLDGGAPEPLVSGHSQDPAWSADGRLLVFSGADIGTTFPVKGATADGRPYSTPNLELTRGGRRLRFLPGRNALVVMRGDIRHKNLWLIDLGTGAERQLTDLPPDFEIRDFDISPEGDALVLEQVQEQSDIVLIDRPAP